MQLCSSANDATAFAASDLNHMIRVGALPQRFHIVLDEAYTMMPNPRALPMERAGAVGGTSTFNYYLRLHRQVLCALLSLEQHGDGLTDGHTARSSSAHLVFWWHGGESFGAHCVLHLMTSPLQSACVASCTIFASIALPLSDWRPTPTSGRQRQPEILLTNQTGSSPFPPHTRTHTPWHTHTHSP